MSVFSVFAFRIDLPAAVTLTTRSSVTLTARRNMLVKILLTAAQQCWSNLYDKSRPNRSNGVKGLQSTNKLVHSAMTSRHG